VTNEGFRELGVAPASAWLDNAEVCQEAISAATALPCARKAELESFYTYLVVDEPIVQLMPAYFLPAWAEQAVQPESLRVLAVAAKLENARARWIDEMVDDHEASVSLVSSHGLNDAIVGLVNRCFRQVLPGEPGGRFFDRLAMLYARHSLSLVLDGKRWGSLDRPLMLADYEEHAKVRHSPVRAPLDALLSLLRADRDLWARATNAWHAWGIGAQLYDDALDVEEDFRRGDLTWTVGRTLDLFDGRVPKDADEFYEVALREGVVAATLARAEVHFSRAAELAQIDFPRWASVQEGCRRQARELRDDFERLLSPGGRER
jgi:hypothetical protein